MRLWDAFNGLTDDGQIAVVALVALAAFGLLSIAESGWNAYTFYCFRRSIRRRDRDVRSLDAIARRFR